MLPKGNYYRSKDSLEEYARDYRQGLETMDSKVYLLVNFKIGLLMLCWQAGTNPYCAKVQRGQ